MPHNARYIWLYFPFKCKLNTPIFSLSRSRTHPILLLTFYSVLYRVASTTQRDLDVRKMSMNICCFTFSFFHSSPPPRLPISVGIPDEFLSWHLKDWLKSSDTILFTSLLRRARTEKWLRVKWLRAFWVPGESILKHVNSPYARQTSSFFYVRPPVLLRSFVHSSSVY